MTFLLAQGGPLSALADLRVGHPGREQRGSLMYLAQPPHDGPDQLVGPLAVDLELLGERDRRAQVAGHECVREVVRARGRVGGREPLDVGRRHVRRRMQGDGDLLELAREPLLARADARHELLRRLPVELKPELAGVPDAPLGQLPGLGGGVLAGLAAGLLDGLVQLLGCLAAGNEDEDGFGRHVGERLFQRGELVRLPGPDVVHQQVARAGIEAQHGEGAGDLAGVALPRVEQLEPAGPALGLRTPANPSAPGVDLGVIVAADEVGRLEIGHADESKTTAARPTRRLPGWGIQSRSPLRLRAQPVVTSMRPFATLSVTVPWRSVL